MAGRQTNLALSTVSRANGLAIIPAGMEQLRAGDVRLLQKWGGKSSEYHVEDHPEGR